jgi:hypothetical protein
MFGSSIQENELVDEKSACHKLMTDGSIPAQAMIFS